MWELHWIKTALFEVSRVMLVLSCSYKFVFKWLGEYDYTYEYIRMNVYKWQSINLYTVLLFPWKCEGKARQDKARQGRFKVILLPPPLYSPYFPYSPTPSVLPLLHLLPLYSPYSLLLSFPPCTLYLPRSVSRELLPTPITPSLVSPYMNHWDYCGRIIITSTTVSECMCINYSYWKCVIVSGMLCR